MLKRHFLNLNTYVNILLFNIPNFFPDSLKYTCIFNHLLKFNSQSVNAAGLESL